MKFWFSSKIFIKRKTLLLFAATVIVVVVVVIASSSNKSMHGLSLIPQWAFTYMQLCTCRRRRQRFASNRDDFVLPLTRTLSGVIAVLIYLAFFSTLLPIMQKLQANTTTRATKIFMWHFCKMWHEWNALIRQQYTGSSPTCGHILEINFMYWH